MIKLKNLSLLGLLYLCLSCITEPEERSSYQPILMTRNQLERSIIGQSSRTIINPGKIYTKGNYIFINEKYKGIHIIDNHDPSKPKQIGFITVPGSIDIAIKGNSLYADNAIDLVAIDISDISKVVETGREKNVFPALLPPDMNFMPTKYEEGNRPENTIIVGWEDIP